MGRPKKYEEEDESEGENDSYGSIIAGSEDDMPFNEDDDGSFVLPTPSSSSSSSYVSDNEEDEFDVSSDDPDEMESEPSCGNIDAATVIDMFAASNPAQYIKKNAAKELQMQLLDLLTEYTDKVNAFPDHSTYADIKCIAVEAHGHCLRVYKNARNKPTEMTLDESHVLPRVAAFLVLNNFKQVIKSWRKHLGDEKLYLQLQTAMSVV